MLKIRIICIGKLKEKFYSDAVAEFKKRLSRYCTLEILELPDDKSPDKLTHAEIELVKQSECRRIAEKLHDSETVVALDIGGTQLSSTELAEKFNQWMNESRSRIAMIIGGSNGLTRELLMRADFRISFSRMTFSHQLFRVMLLEQIYRAFRINSGEPYHK